MGRNLRASGYGMRRPDPTTASVKANSMEMLV